MKVGELIEKLTGFDKNSSIRIEYNDLDFEIEDYTYMVDREVKQDEKNGDCILNITL